VDEVVAGVGQFLTLLPSFPYPTSTYFPNFNLANLNDKFTQFNASLNKLYYEGSNRLTLPQLPSPSTLTSSSSVVRERVINLYNALVDEEYKENQKRKEFEKVRREFIDKLSKNSTKKSTLSRSLDKSTSEKKVDRKFLGNEKTSSQEESQDKSILKEDDDDDETDPLSDEFWSTAFDNSTTTMAGAGGVGSGDDSTKNRPPLNPFYSRLSLTPYDKIKVSYHST